MAGSAEEWVADWFADYPRRAVTDPKGPRTGSERVMRGGHWGGDVADARTFNRRADPPNIPTHGAGLRVARDGR